MDDGQSYAGQVMFRHFGNPDRFLVAWTSDVPPGHDGIADWVDASRCDYLETQDAPEPWGGGFAAPAPTPRESAVMHGC